MKIVCDACSAKYSIADDKVKGKVFKIRCKKCSNIIVVRGTAGAGGAEEPAAPQFDQKDTRVYDYGYDEAGGGGAAAGGDAGGDAEAVWHLVIDQEQVGPLTVAEVGQKFAAGQVDAESYVWREGFADWQPLSSVDAFAGVVSSGGGGGAAAGGSSGRDAVASMFGASAGDEQGTVRSDPGDLFGAAARGGTEDAGGDDAGDLFGARAAAAPAVSSGDDGGGGGGRSRPARDSSGGKLRGERNENSVLFSLGNLAALASDAPRSAGPSLSSSSAASAASASGGAAQHGGGEGSGLIDIRSMATAYLGPQGAQRKAASNVGSIDDLPVFTSSSFAEPAVIMPSPQGRQNNKTMVILIAAVGALAVITLVLVLVVVLGGKGNSSAGAGTGSTVASNGKGTGDKPPGPGSDKLPAGGSDDGSGKGTAADPGTGTASGTNPGTGAEAGTGSASGSDSGSAATDPGTGTGSAKKPDKSTDKPDKTHTDHSHDKTTTEKPDKPDKPDKPVADPGGKCMDEVGCLLADKPPACCSKYTSKTHKDPNKKPPPDKTDTGSDLPESLDSGMIKDGVGKVKSKIFACGDKYPSAKGTLKLSVKVDANGTVTSASAVQSPDPGLGTCAAGAIKGAKFGKTQRGGSFKYPFNF